MKSLNRYINNIFEFTNKNILFCISSGFIIGIVLSVEFYFKNFILVIIILFGIYIYYFFRTHIINLLLLLVIVFVCFGYIRSSAINNKIESNNSFLESVGSEYVFYGKVLYNDYKVDGGNISVVNIINYDGTDYSVVNSIHLQNVLVSHNSSYTLYEDDNITFSITDKTDLVRQVYIKEILDNKYNSNYIYTIQDVNKRSIKVDNLLRVDSDAFVDELIKNFDYNIPSPHKELILGLIIGRSGAYNKTLYNQLYITGTTHIISVSGYNISLVISYVLFLSSIIGRKKSLLISFMSIIIYMFIVGIENIPVVRATLFGIIYIISKLNGRKKSVYNLIAFSVMIILYFNPDCYREISFQLSYASTIGIMTFSKYLKSKIGILPEWMKENIATTISAILFTMPIILINFGDTSLLSLIVNICILPLVPVITIGGIVFTILMFIKFPYLKIISYILYIFTDIIIEIIYMFANVSVKMARYNVASSRIVYIVLGAITTAELVGIIRNAKNNHKIN